jgi:CxxC motif-containing protein (DUF1111 family)
MKLTKLFLSTFGAAALVIPMASSGLVKGQVPDEGPAPDPTAAALTEAPQGFGGNNGAVDAARFAAATEEFESIDTFTDGLGPVFNARSCADCHAQPVSGGVTVIFEMRAGHTDSSGVFHDHPGGSLIHSHAVDPSIQEKTLEGNETHALRSSLPTLGDGFVEAVSNQLLLAIAANQPRAQRGTAIAVAVAEVPGGTRIGRFGWKDQQASLLSFSADAYLNEMGITSPLAPTENTSNGRPIPTCFGQTTPGPCDPKPDPEDADGADIAKFADFMRASLAPPADAQALNSADGRAGSLIFGQIGCSTCHVRTLITVPTGTVINAGGFTVPAALGDKIFHPFGDFLLHDVGTGDGIVQNGGQGTRNMVRTIPLWGCRVRVRMLHDGRGTTLSEVVNFHSNQGASAAAGYNSLSPRQKAQLGVFVGAL